MGGKIGIEELKRGVKKGKSLVHFTAIKELEKSANSLLLNVATSRYDFDTKKVLNTILNILHTMVSFR